MVKRFIVTVVVCVAIILVLLISPFIINPLLNDYRLHNFAKQLKNYPLPDNTEIIDMQAICGKLSGNGNGMDFFTCILIKSELEIEEIVSHYSMAARKPVKRFSGHEVTIIIDVVKSPEVESDYIENQVMFFEILKDIADYSGYYYLMGYDGGYSPGFDLRGN